MSYESGFPLINNLQVFVYGSHVLHNVVVLTKNQEAKRAAKLH